MKKLITILLTLVSLTVNSQVIDWDNFDTSIADSVLFVEMNKFRDSLGLSTFIYSKVIHDNISTYSTGEMVKEKRTFHPDKKDLVKKYKSSTKTEIINKANIKTYNSPILVGPYEVGVGTFQKEGLTYYSNTYSGLAKKLIERWCKSKPHYEILILEHGNGKTSIGVGAGSIQLGQGETNSGGYFQWDAIYATFHISKLIY